MAMLVTESHMNFLSDKLHGSEYIFFFIVVKYPDLFIETELSSLNEEDRSSL